MKKQYSIPSIKVISMATRKPMLTGSGSNNLSIDFDLIPSFDPIFGE